MNEIEILQSWLDSGAISANGLLRKKDIQVLINSMKFKAENLPISDVVGRDLWEKVDCKDCEGTGLYIPDLEAEYNMHCRVCGGDGKVMKKVES